MRAPRELAAGVRDLLPGTGVCAYTCPRHSRRHRTATASSTSGSQPGSWTPAAYTRPRTRRSSLMEQQAALGGEAGGCLRSARAFASQLPGALVYKSSISFAGCVAGEWWYQGKAGVGRWTS